MTATLIEIPLIRITPHPDNPRLLIREDVVAAIAANLNGVYPKKHAVHVRPVNGTYQLLSGHQRIEAARRVGVEKVWAWVEDLDDEAAFMELVTSNNQGELSPLEIGMHALKGVPKEAGGRGRTGGLADYARRVGMSKQYLSQIRDAAGVLASLEKSSSQLYGFLDKAQHLAAIHRLDRRELESHGKASIGRGWGRVTYHSRPERQVKREIRTPACLDALGLVLPCTAADVRRAYRQRARELHPDGGGDHDAFLALQRHYEQSLGIMGDDREESAA